MKKIKTFQIWNNGILVEATKFQLKAISVELENSATFYYGLFSEDNVKLNEGNLFMDKNDYKGWEFDQYAWDWAATKLNLSLLPNEELPNEQLPKNQL
jgi:hypothetical protein